MTSTGTGSGRMVRAIILLGLVIVAGLVIQRVYRWVDAPWSIGSADSTPFGDWVAPVTLEDGTTGTMLMTLEDVVDEAEDFSSANLEGTAHYCLGDTAGDFDVYGRDDGCWLSLGVKRWNAAHYCSRISMDL